MRASRFESPSSWRCSGVGPGSSPLSSSATRPISVRMPVSVTTSSARPRTTVVFMNAEPGAVAEGGLGVGHGRGPLLDRHRLAGQRGLVDRQVRRHHQAAVGRDPVAGLEQHDVAGHELVGGDLDDPVVAPHPDPAHQHLLQGVEGVGGLGLLDVAEHGVDQQHHADDDRVLHVAEGPRQHRGAGQDEHDPAAELVDEELPPRLRGGSASWFGPNRAARSPTSSVLSPSPGSTSRRSSTSTAVMVCQAAGGSSTGASVGLRCGEGVTAAPVVVASRGRGRSRALTGGLPHPEAGGSGVTGRGRISVMTETAVSGYSPHVPRSMPQPGAAANAPAHRTRRRQGAGVSRPGPGGPLPRSRW